MSAIPDHPLNADLLHQHIRKHKLPQRDAFWLPYLNNYYGDDSSVNRLFVWGLDGLGKDKIQNKSLRLAGITLAWFLASSNRFLRDRATKALVTIFVERLTVLFDILKKFEKIDDPYIEERLYAAAYGSVLQSKDNVTKLALYVYNRFFKNSKPPTHILLRDYARGIIETVLNKNTALKHKINVAKIRPPYSSTFPTKIPSLAELKRKYYPERIISKPPKLGDYGEIWRSLMYNNEGGISDFGNYVVNTALNHWCDLKLSKDGSRKKTAKEMNEEFITSLDRKKKSAWRKLEDMRQSMFLRMTILDFPKKENVNSSDVKITIKQLQAIKRQHQFDEKSLIKTLNKHQQKLYRQGVLPYRNNHRGSNDLEVAEIKRLIFQRIIKLGWRPKLFAEFDSTVRDRDRSAYKSERIGKKYQWIAFHEILGRIADNFVFRGNWNENFEPYQGPWQTWARDIDPSCLLQKKPIGSTANKSWWVTATYKNWRPSLGHTQWTRIKTDLPDQKKLLEVKAKGGWVILDGYYRWEQPPHPGEERFDKIRRDVWYILRSYIINKKDSATVFDWAKKIRFYGKVDARPFRNKTCLFKGISIIEFI